MTEVTLVIMSVVCKGEAFAKPQPEFRIRLALACAIVRQAGLCECFAPTVCQPNHKS
jgi:hypothetical protein